MIPAPIPGDTARVCGTSRLYRGVGRGFAIGPVGDPADIERDSGVGAPSLAVDHGSAEERRVLVVDDRATSLDQSHRCGPRRNAGTPSRPGVRASRKSTRCDGSGAPGLPGALVSGAVSLTSVVVVRGGALSVVAVALSGVRVVRAEHRAVFASLHRFAGANLVCADGHGVAPSRFRRCRLPGLKSTPLRWGDHPANPECPRSAPRPRRRSRTPPGC